MPSLSLFILLTLFITLTATQIRAFVFSWSDTSYQCYTQTLSWTGGVPPFTAIITPTLQMPFVYKIPASAWDASTQTGKYDIQMQLSSGISYVLWMSDAVGVGTGGSSRQLVVLGYDQTSCLLTASQNQTNLDFSVEVFAVNPIQCKPSFRLDWSQTARLGAPPFNMTVLSLDQTFDPYDVNFGANDTALWTPNVEAGKMFTFMMNDAKGYGTGGTGQSYTVNSTETGDTSCLNGGGNQTITPGISHTKTSTAATSAVSTGTSGGDNNNNDGLSKAGVYTVAVISAVVGVAASAAIAFACLIWRRRRRNVRRRGASGSTNGNGKPPAGSGFGSRVNLFMGGGRRNESRNNHQHNEVDLYDTNSAFGRDDHSPGGAGLRTLSSTDNSYLPVPYTPGGDSPSSYDQDMYNVPLSAGSRTANRSRDALGPIGTEYSRTTWHSSVSESGAGDSPNPDNPFEGRELNQEDSMAALLDRKWPVRQQSLDTPAGTVNVSGGLSPLNGTSRTGTPLLPNLAIPPEAISRGLPSSAQRSKEEEMLAEVARARAGEQVDTGSNPDSPYGTTNTSASGAMAGQSAFRITNAGEGDPVLAAPPPSATLPRGAGSHGASGRGRRRLVDPFDTAQPRFVRHADAGRLTREEEVIDLPPLYTDLVPSNSNGSRGNERTREEADRSSSQ